VQGKRILYHHATVPFDCDSFTFSANRRRRYARSAQPMRVLCAPRAPRAAHASPRPQGRLRGPQTGQKRAKTREKEIDLPKKATASAGALRGLPPAHTPNAPRPQLGAERACDAPTVKSRLHFCPLENHLMLST
jgi:hypothetical protein